MKTLLFIALFLAVYTVASAQEYIGHTDSTAVFLTDVVRKGNSVKFTGLATPYDPEVKRQVVDPDNYLETYFVADCLSLEFYATGFKGKVQGKAVGITQKSETLTAQKPMIIWNVIDAACHEKPVTGALSKLDG